MDGKIKKSADVKIFMNNNMPEIPDISAQELLSSYHEGLKEAVDFVQSKVIGVLSGQINLKQQEEAVLGIFYRTHTLASSLVRLNNKIDFGAVASIARTIFELLLDIKLLSSSKVKRKDLDRFFAFPEVSRYRTASKIVDLQKNHPELANNSLLNSAERRKFVDEPGKASDIEKKVVLLWGRDSKGKPNWPKYWFGRSIRKHAETFGPWYEQEYLEVYSLLSSYTHGGSSGYSGFSDKALESVYGISLEYARKMYIESLLICSNLFNLKEGIESFTQIVTFLKNAPKQILIDYKLKEFKARKDNKV